MFSLLLIEVISSQVFLCFPSSFFYLRFFSFDFYMSSYVLELTPRETSRKSQYLLPLVLHLVDNWVGLHLASSGQFLVSLNFAYAMGCGEFD